GQRAGLPADLLDAGIGELPLERLLHERGQLQRESRTGSPHLSEWIVWWGAGAVDHQLRWDLATERVLQSLPQLVPAALEGLEANAVGNESGGMALILPCCVVPDDETVGLHLLGEFGREVVAQRAHSWSAHLATVAQSYLPAFNSSRAFAASFHAGNRSARGAAHRMMPSSRSGSHPRPAMRSASSRNRRSSSASDSSASSASATARSERPAPPASRSRTSRRISASAWSSRSPA